MEVRRSAFEIPVIGVKDGSSTVTGAESQWKMAYEDDKQPPVKLSVHFLQSEL